jgi:mannose-1-phosphate guanylyltransferase
MRVMQGEVAQMEMPGREVKSGVWVGLNVRVPWDKVDIQGPVYIGSGTEIEEGVRIIGPVWIGHGCHVGRNAEISRSVLFEYTHTGEGARFDEVLLYRDYCVNHKGETIHSHESPQHLMWGDARGR